METDLEMNTKQEILIMQMERKLSKFQETVREVQNILNLIYRKPSKEIDQLLKIFLFYKRF